MRKRKKRDLPYFIFGGEKKVVTFFEKVGFVIRIVRPENSSIFRCLDLPLFLLPFVPSLCIVPGTLLSVCSHGCHHVLSPLSLSLFLSLSLSLSPSLIFASRILRLEHVALWQAARLNRTADKKGDSTNNDRRKHNSEWKRGRKKQVVLLFRRRANAAGTDSAKKCQQLRRRRQHSTGGLLDLTLQQQKKRECFRSEGSESRLD